MSISPWKSEWSEVREIASGGQGVVWELKSKKNGERAVLKRIVEKWRTDPQARERLEKEADTLGRLNAVGASVPKLISSSIGNSDSEPFIVMEYINGPRFDEWLRESGPVSLKDAAEITLAIAAIIQACHDQKIGHRDLKPKNIIFTNGDVSRPCVVDFGISFDSAQTFALTKEGEMFRNEFIQLPECTDLAGGHRDLRSDITALVGILFSCLTGEAPIVLRDKDFRLPHVRHRDQVRNALKSSRDNERVSWFFEKGFAYPIDERFQDLKELVERLNAFLVEGEKLPLDVHEQFQLLDRALVANDRPTQIGLLQKKSQSILRVLNEKFMKAIEKVGGDIGGANTPISVIGAKFNRWKEMGDYLGDSAVQSYTFKRQHQRMCIVIGISMFAVKMRIDVCVWSYLATAARAHEVVSPVELEKIAEVSDDEPALTPEKADSICVDLVEGLARAIRALKLRVEEGK